MLRLLQSNTFDTNLFAGSFEQILRSQLSSSQHKIYTWTNFLQLNSGIFGARLVQVNSVASKQDFALDSCELKNMFNASKPHILNLGSSEEINQKRLESLIFQLCRVSKRFSGKQQAGLASAGYFGVFEILKMSTYLV